MHDDSAEEAQHQMPSSPSVKTEATNSNGHNQGLKAAIDACECKCHSNRTAESCENAKSHVVTDCKHCQLQPCLLFKDFSKEWQYSSVPIFFAKQLPVDNIHSSLPCSLNRIAWNTNYGFHKWLAVGGQAGILRIILSEENERNHMRTKRKNRKKR